MKRLEWVLSALVLILIVVFFIFISMKIKDYKYKKFDEPRVRQTVEKVLIEKGLIKEEHREKK